ncbi:HET-domain-containing protein, partial [Aulographum hederae CBS 113979]
HVGHARAVHPRWIDFDLLKQWKLSCQQEHNTCEQPLAKSSSSGPMWLIDTWNHCLVPASPDYPYLALSYVWGTAKQFTAQQENLQSLQKPLALRAGSIHQQLPSTVRHAITLTEALGDRYLWVDALCVVQDDSINKHKELANMSGIFQKASITIIARQGQDADYGLRGLRNISQPRSFVQDRYPLGRGVCAVEVHFDPYLSKQSVWQTRGWTFQEDLFSRRKLVFDDDSVYWRCNERVWHEESSHSQIDLDSPHVYMRGLLSRGHQMENLRNMLQLYNIRKFSYPEDTLKAFWGVATAVSVNFKNGFMGGLPAVRFDVALLWQPDTGMHRRIGRSKGSRKCWLPSWSWAGWRGRLDPRSLTQASDCLVNKVRTTERVVPIVQWYTHKSPTSEGNPILQEWYDARQKYLGTERSPPDGWERFAYEDHIDHPGVYGYPPEGDHFPKYYFKRAGQHQDYQKYWYPIPVPHTDDGASALTIPWMISCRTRRCVLYRAEQIYHCLRAIVSIRDQNRKWIGALQFTQDAISIGTATATTIKYINRVNWQKRRVELVEISRGYIYEFQMTEKPDEWDHDERPKSAEKYEFYNVMCIEWGKDGLASRKGLGRVHKDAWEQQSLEWIDLKL